MLGARQPLQSQRGSGETLLSPRGLGVGGGRSAPSPRPHLQRRIPQAPPRFAQTQREPSRRTYRPQVLMSTFPGTDAQRRAKASTRPGQGDSVCLHLSAPPSPKDEGETGSSRGKRAAFWLVVGKLGLWATREDPRGQSSPPPLGEDALARLQPEKGRVRGANSGPKGPAAPPRAWRAGAQGQVSAPAPRGPNPPPQGPPGPRLDPRGSEHPASRWPEEGPGLQTGKHHGTHLRLLGAGHLHVRMDAPDAGKPPLLPPPKGAANPELQPEGRRWNPLD